MKTYYITFRSVTFAQRGEKLLQRHGYRCHMQRTPRWMEERGCGYCLKLWLEDVWPPVLALQAEGVPLRRVYAQGSGGTLEEMAL